MNYDIVGNLAGSGMGATGALDFRAFSAMGVVSSGWLAFSGANRPATLSGPLLRLDGGAYGRLDQDASVNLVEYSLNSAEHTRIVSANYSVTIHRMSIYANEFRSLLSQGSNGLQEPGQVWFSN